MALRYILAIDGGGTKVLAELKEQASGATFRAQAGSASISNDLDLALENIVKVTRDVCQQSGAKPSEIVTVMGVAGGSSQSLTDISARTGGGGGGAGREGKAMTLGQVDSKS